MVASLQFAIFIMNALLFARISLFLTLSQYFGAVYSLVIDRADTPLFYLIADPIGTTGRPVLLDTRSGTATLNGQGSPAQFFFYQGRLEAIDDRSGTGPRFRPYINTAFSNTGSCANYGPLRYINDGSTSANRCATYDTFTLQSFPENGQFGAKLVLNAVGGFYSCGTNREIYYKINEADGPGNCSPTQLFTLPVI